MSPRDYGLPARVPSTGNVLTRAIGRTVMRLTGWQLTGAMPDLEKFVIVVAPHTSNWDFVHATAAKVSLGLEARWIGKHTLFRWPFSMLLRRMGGFPVKRDRAQAVVSQVVAEFAARAQMVFVLAPEGTRARVEKWRSGYWHIASQARVPFVPVGLDYARKAVVIGTPLAPTDSQEHDERALRAFFANIHPRKPEQYAV